MFILSPDRELFQMPEEAWGAQDSLLTHTDAEVLGKPMAHLSKVMNDNHCNLDSSSRGYQCQSIEFNKYFITACLLLDRFLIACSGVSIISENCVFYKGHYGRLELFLRR